MKICAIIPAYNESKKIKQVIEKAKEQGLEVIVIDDGSNDETADVSEKSGAIVLKNYKNLGKGASLKKGFNFALKHNFDIAITLDGDGQHDAGEIKTFLDEHNKNSSDIIIGSRMNDIKNMPLIRRFTNRTTSLIISRLAHSNIKDSQSGFRLITSNVLKKIKLTEKKYDLESELLIKAGRLGFKIREVNIKTIYKDEKSKINPLKDTLRFIKLVLKNVV